MQCLRRQCHISTPGAHWVDPLVGSMPCPSSPAVAWTSYASIQLHSQAPPCSTLFPNGHCVPVVEGSIVVPVHLVVSSTDSCVAKVWSSHPPIATIPCQKKKNISQSWSTPGVSQKKIYKINLQKNIHGRPAWVYFFSLVGTPGASQPDQPNQVHDPKNPKIPPLPRTCQPAHGTWI